MVQIYEKFERKELERVKEYFVIFPETEEKVEELAEKKVKLTKKQSRSRKYAKQHQEKVNVVKMKNKIDASIYRGGLYPR
ncbi:MAG: hypothetical protein ACW986_08955 [Promethearchaeota archaeon]|jgi:hypothetical protein